MLKSIPQRLADELNAREAQVAAAIQLLDEGSTVPFIARYRKEVTGGLDDTQLRMLEERLRYMRELEERRDTVLKSIDEQGKLTDELRSEIMFADNKTRLEDLYLPYKPKRRTKAQIAREAGLQPLADSLLNDPTMDPEATATAYISIDRGIADTKAALDGARQILMEQFAEDAELLGRLRDHLWQQGVVWSVVVEGKNDEGTKFADYFEYNESLKAIPSHRALALFRGRNEGILNIALRLVDEDPNAPRSTTPNACEAMVASHFGIKDAGRSADRWLLDTVRMAWRVKIFLHLELELMNQLREAAEAEAIKVFSANLKDLLLAAPAGPKATIGLDPGLRTGVKVAVVDRTGKLVDTATVYPHAPRNDWDQAIAVVAALAATHKAELISIGNGTASRETDKLVLDLFKRHPELKLQKLVVSEAGASVYSASELAAREFPELDVSLRGAVSIARRLQDPLAELVKIDPKSIGVGQYQHDVNQGELARTLGAVVEDCVNAVGVDVNTASVPLLTRVSGLTTSLASSIVAYRDANGAFKNRKELKQVPRLGEKTFEQAAGFLRIMNGDNPLDRSAVHPEAYPVVERIIAQCGRQIDGLIGDSGFLKKLSPAEFTDEKFGVPTVKDILTELEKPGRDPRPEFKTAEFKEGVEEIGDLQPDMILEGVVTNVTNFGAFVDIGVHQDGLVHISALSEKFVKDPREVVKAGDVVKVKVLEVDAKRKRIALTMRIADKAKEHVSGEIGRSPASNREKQAVNRVNRDSQSTQQSAMAAAFAKLKR
ncbi:Tex family protein [Chitinivorax sp. B]|uniref:Tex family protein n=1 Tax=Chitinivorax sp. B TaxID=2502235 RepID=UPI0010F44FAC|nr:Tex family protein [Chitinivorax sp. B]